MQQHREEAQTAAVRRRMEDAAIPADLQAMLLRQQVILVLTCQMVFPRLTYAYIYSNITETLLKDNFQLRCMVYTMGLKMEDMTHYHLPLSHKFNKTFDSIVGVYLH